MVTDIIFCSGVVSLTCQLPRQCPTTAVSSRATCWTPLRLEGWLLRSPPGLCRATWPQPRRRRTGCSSEALKCLESSFVLSHHPGRRQHLGRDQGQGWHQEAVQANSAHWGWFSCFCCWIWMRASFKLVCSGAPRSCPSSSEWPPSSRISSSCCGNNYWAQTTSTNVTNQQHYFKRRALYSSNKHIFAPVSIPAPLPHIFIGPYNLSVLQFIQEVLIHSDSTQYFKHSLVASLWTGTILFQTSFNWIVVVCQEKLSDSLMEMLTTKLTKIIYWD